MAEVAAAPSFFDAHVCFLYFVFKPFVDKFLLLMILVHVLYRLKIICKICLMGVYAVGETDECHNLAVAFGIAHDEGLGDLTYTKLRPSRSVVIL